jgi:hypothetical protein
MITRDFRLVVLVHGLQLDEITSFSGVIDQCDLITISAPMTIKTAISATLSSLANLRFDPLRANLAFFDAAASVLNQHTLFAPYPSFFNFQVALLCSNERDALAGKFVSEFCYELPDDRLWGMVKTARSVYPLPRSFAAKAVQSVLDEFPCWDDPQSFELPRKSFALSQEKMMAQREPDCELPADEIKASDLFRTELFLLTLARSHGLALPFIGRRLQQVAEGGMVDFSLLLTPAVLIEKVKAMGILNDGLKCPMAVIGATVRGVQVCGLISQDARWDAGGFKKGLGCTELPVLHLGAVEKLESRPMANLWHGGRVVTRIGIIGTVARGVTVNLFPKPL